MLRNRTACKITGCVAFALAMAAGSVASADYIPIPLTTGSFTRDVVVESGTPAPVVAGGYTTASMDAGLGNTAFTWYEQGYNLAAPATGLPSAGANFIHQNAGDHQFQMASSYRSNNAVLLDSSLTTGAISLVTPTVCSRISLLQSSGSGAVSITVVIRHTDGSAQTNGMTFSDWFNGAAPAWTANGRVNAGTFAFDNVNGNNPRLYATDLNLSNSVSPVLSLELTYASGSGHGVIFAVSGSVGGNFTPLGMTGYNADVIVESDGPHAGALSGVTTATMDNGAVNTQNTWYEAGYVRRHPDTGLPPAGSTLTNASALDHRYLLPPNYSANNGILLNTSVSSAVLTPVTPAAFPGLSFLVSAGHGPATIGCSIRYASGAMGTNFFVVPDWFSGTPVAWYGRGRVNVSTRTVDSVGGSNPRLYAADIALTVTTSPVTNIVLSFVTGAAGANVVVFGVSGGSATPGLGGDDWNANTEAAAFTLQQWYNGGGLYDTTGWWNAANCLEAVENAIQSNNGRRYLEVLTNTFNLNSGGNFLNNYYDDEGWWALAWIRAFDLTGNPSFLNMAKTIFTDLLTGWDTTCGGGVWWSKDRTYKNAIANELFMLVAVRLHQRTSGDLGPGSYWYWATNSWSWFKASGMINGQNLVNDGLNASCLNNGQTTWTYNQGVILGALTDLYKETGDTNYLNQATAIADAAIVTLVDGAGVLREPCESGGCGADGPQFKGIFIRYLAYLYDTQRKASYGAFLFKNAHAVWFNDRNSFGQLGLKWNGPFDGADAARQSSALMAVSALAAPYSSNLPFAKGAGDVAFTHVGGGSIPGLGWNCAATNTAAPGYIQTGPGITYLEPGVHVAHFGAAVSGLGGDGGNLVRFEVRNNTTGTTLASRIVTWSEFAAANVPQDFPLRFTNDLGSSLDFRVYWYRMFNTPNVLLTDVTVDGLMNWTGANLAHDLGRLNGLNAWTTDPRRDAVSGYLARGPGVQLPAGNYQAQFELRVDNFNWDNAAVATLAIVDADLNATIASQTISRGQFVSVLYQQFVLNFTAQSGVRYDFRTFWHFATNAPRLSLRSVALRPGAAPFFTAVASDGTSLALDFVGVPGRAYTLQVSDLALPVQWNNVGSVTIPINLGWSRFTDTLQSSNRFYRLRFP